MGENSGILGGLKRAVDKAAVATGIAEAVPVRSLDKVDKERIDEVDQPQVAASSPSVPRSRPAVLGAAVLTPPVTVSHDSNSDSEVEKQFQAHFPDILKAMPVSFQNFLTQKAELMESLRDSVDQNKLEEAAVKSALRIAKLSAKDLKDAMQAGRSAFSELRADFNANLSERRKELVEGPNKTIGEIRQQISDIDRQMTELARRKTALESDIAPHERSITEAEEDLRYASQVFASVCDRITAALAAMEKQFTNGR